MRLLALSKYRGTLATLAVDCAKYATRGHLMVISTVIGVAQESTKKKCAHSASISFTQYQWITSSKDKEWPTFSNASFAVICWLNLRRATIVRVITAQGASQESWTRLIGVPNAASISQLWKTCQRDWGSHLMKFWSFVGVSMLKMDLLKMQRKAVVRL